MRYVILFFSLVLVLTSSSCRKDFSTIPSNGQLSFSKDTVFLDTVFSTIGSATYSLKIYNTSKSDITIPSIQLEKGSTSKYRLNVDGIAGRNFENIDILAKDSIYLFVETTVDVALQTSPLYTDKILFDSGNEQQDVDLVTLVQDAHFIFPGRNPISLAIDQLSLDNEPTEINGRFLEDNELVFSNEKPIVIYGYAAVPSNKILTVEAGAKIYFHNDSGLIVDKGASLQINGSSTEKVIIEGDRLEHSFDKIAGQWGAIWLRAGSVNNQINHTEIKNGAIGILVDSIVNPLEPTLQIANTKIYNHSNYGILGRATSIDANNLVVGNAGQVSLAATVGGTYNFTHCTFANYWTNSNRQLPTVLVNNFFAFTDASGQEIIETRDLNAANFVNCIINGNNHIEFVLDKVDDGVFAYKLENNMIRFNDINGDYDEVVTMDFSDTIYYTDNILNGTADFKDPFTNDFTIGQNNSGIGKAKESVSNLFPFDILGTSRNPTSDIGAYQHVVFENE